MEILFLLWYWPGKCFGNKLFINMQSQHILEPGWRYCICSLQPTAMLFVAVGILNITQELTFHWLYYKWIVTHFSWFRLQIPLIFIEYDLCIHAFNHSKEHVVVFIPFRTLTNARHQRRSKEFALAGSSNGSMSIII